MWYDAGQPIPDQLVPDHALQYRISEKEGAKLYAEILEWRAIVAERKAKKEREAKEERARRRPLRPLRVETQMASSPARSGHRS